VVVTGAVKVGLVPETPVSGGATGGRKPLRGPPVRALMRRNRWGAPPPDGV